nr:DeoR/GlpR family DNA-binding transcription regulator [Schumannella luteola]
MGAVDRHGLRSRHRGRSRRTQPEAGRRAAHPLREGCCPVTAPRREPAEVRRRRIVELTEQNDYLRPAEIAAALNVSGETVRRDLLALEQTGELRRVHGGAMASTVRSSEPKRSDRSATSLERKREIAAIVASLVSIDDTVFMDVGTTIEAAAASLPPEFAGSVVTNSLAVGGILNERREMELYLVGGRVRVGEMTTYGPDALSQLEGFNASLAFIGSGGIHVEAGMTDYSTDDAAVKQLMIAQAERTYILATSEKLGTRARRFVCELQSVAGVITDSDAEPRALDELRAAGVTVLTPADLPDPA